MDIANIPVPLFPEPFEAGELITGACNEESKIYDQLNANRREIRLLRLVDDKQSERIAGIIESHALNEVPPYTAVSYTWGNHSGHRKVDLNGHATEVSENLWRFLSNICILQQKERNEHRQWFWIDALCINQRNMGERTQQVLLMAEIYSKADRVLVWLGPAYQGSDKAMKALARDATYWHIKKCYLRFWKQAGGTELVQLCRRRYWTRLWTFQELEMAREIYLMCGTRLVPWDNFESFLLHTASSSCSIPEQHEHIRLALLGTPAMARLKQQRMISGKVALLQLMEDTKHLKCSEPRDKVYALLGVVESGIKPDYERPLVVLLNEVLRDHHLTNPPKSLDEIIAQCKHLSSMMNIELESMFDLPSGWGLTPVPAAADKRHHPLSVAPGLINLWWTSFYGHTAIERMIFRSGRIGDIDLAHACKGQCTAAVELLLRIGPFNINGQHMYGRTILSDAIVRGDDKIALHVIAQPSCNVNLRDQAGNSPLMQAMACNRRVIVEALLGRRDLDADDADRSALHLGRTELIRACLLVSGRWHAGYVYNADRHPLSAATRRDLEPFALLFLERTGSPNYNNLKGRNALAWACRSNMISVVEALLSGGADPNGKDEVDGTPLMSALTYPVEGPNHYMIDVLLLHGANPNITVNGRSPLEIAIREMYTEVLILFIKHHADVEGRDSNGNTALMLAAMIGDEITARVLLDEGNADTNAENNDGQTAYDIATKNGFGAFAQTVREASIIPTRQFHIKDSMF